MRKICFGFLITIFVPNFVFASFADEMNSLLERVFSTNSVQNVETNFVPNFSPEEKESVSGFQTESDFQIKISNEETALQQLEEHLEKMQQEFLKFSDDRGMLESQLQILDEEISTSNKKIEQLLILRQQWQQNLENLTREKSKLRALLRHSESDSNDFLSNNFIQKTNFSSAGLGLTFRWIFSDRSMAKIQESQQRERELEKQKLSSVEHLKTRKSQLDLQEKIAAKTFGRVSDLTEQISTQKRLLTELADAKARVRSNLELEQGNLEKSIARARSEQADSTVFIQNLRQEFATRDFEKTEKMTAIISEKKLQFPLPIEPIVTAEFRDPDYFSKLGREHWGTDFWAAQGTDIFAPADGVIKKVAQNGYSYSCVVIDHGDDFFTVFGHVSDVLLREGDTLFSGQKFAFTGGTPGTPGAGVFSTGPHLHFEVFQNGKHVDPMKFLK